MATYQKQQGQYMTPDRIVSMILDTVGYKGKNILSFHIMEPSFGDGAFLSEIVRRLISACEETGLDTNETAETLNRNVYGIEKDSELYQKAISRLHTICQEHQLPDIAWEHLLNGDTLLLFEQFCGQLDYVVGNPPFVRIHNMEDIYKDILDKFQFTKGIPDLYVIFYEIGLRMLKETGKLGFITPNSFMRNVSQKSFREYITVNRYISALFDFKNSRLFDADTYTCICILDKNQSRKNTDIAYREYQMYHKVRENTFNHEDFQRNFGKRAWNLTTDDGISFLEQNKVRPVKLHALAMVQNGVATLRDNLFVLRCYTDTSCTSPYSGKHTDKARTVYFSCEKGTFPIESNILRRCVKASKYTGKPDNTYIIFPYQTTKENTCIPFAEDFFSENYPFAYQYMNLVRGELEKRDSDKNAPWFAFGRSQGLGCSGYRKIVFKHIISKEKPMVIPYILDEDVIVYSGLYTIANPNLFDKEYYDFGLSEIQKILSTPEFAKYCVMVGKDMQGGYVHVSAKMVKSFGVPQERLLTK